MPIVVTKHARRLAKITAPNVLVNIRSPVLFAHFSSQLFSLF
jgi:hypothetical protein